LMKKIQAPKVAAIRMQCGEFKLNLCSISWIYLKILPHNLDWYAQLSQQVLLNLDIGHKS